MSNGYPGQPTLTTADGFTSSGNQAEGSRPRMASKWAKRGRNTLDVEQRDSEREEVIDDISSNFRALRDNPSTHLVSWRDSDSLLLLLSIVDILLVLLLRF